MSLETGKRIHKLKWTVLTFIQAVVDGVEKLTENNEEDVTFTDGNGNVVEYEENNDYESDEEEKTSMNMKKKMKMNIKF